MIHYTPFSGSYPPTDVTLLFKLIPVEPVNLFDNNRQNLSGMRCLHELLTVEPLPSAKYVDIFFQTVQHNKQKLAYHVLSLAYLLHTTKEKLTLVSLARAGTPIGVLLKRTLQDIFQRTVPHYSLALLREKGIDENALRYILEVEETNGSDIAFIDAWTGKGILTRELHKWVSLFNHHFNTCIPTKLWVIANVSGSSTVNAVTLEDYVIPSALLNATVSGLTSHTILHRRYIGLEDFFGCQFYQHYREQDVSLWYIEQVMNEVYKLAKNPISYATVSTEAKNQRQQDNASFMEHFMRQAQIAHSNYLYPSIGETIRVLLRDAPKKILVKWPNATDLVPIQYLAEEKQIPIEVFNNMPYQAVGIMN
ncbi:cysteine protease StiP domain-containing protein [Beggiatoa leptomitoformis]|uniref:Uncharacterized protein n=1 Tax=Beggiatoa leptomitoformis TaxID=288004 RepID=A0A2N9YDS4_9GAMM|nr:cysteine protease StiP domain-containing protein [Beggiatoa leptomitoformis]ALG68999.1 hypothetical protein AL038_16510 [Beggiatoa leptomitoformis]AUI68606.1 hypothetical protein BLE401_07735 [Beggiatoa leptomitoformis]